MQAVHLRRSNIFKSIDIATATAASLFPRRIHPKVRRISFAKSEGLERSDFFGLWILHCKTDYSISIFSLTNKIRLRKFAVKLNKIELHIILQVSKWMFATAVATMRLCE